MVNRRSMPVQEEVLTDRLDMTIVVDRGVKPQNKQTNIPKMTQVQSDILNNYAVTFYDCSA